MLAAPLHEDFDVSIVRPHRRGRIGPFKALEFSAPVEFTRLEIYTVFMCHMSLLVPRRDHVKYYWLSNSGGSPRSKN